MLHKFSLVQVAPVAQHSAVPQANTLCSGAGEEIKFLQVTPMPPVRDVLFPTGMVYLMNRRHSLMKQMRIAIERVLQTAATGAPLFFAFPAQYKLFSAFIACYLSGLNTIQRTELIAA